MFARGIVLAGLLVAGSFYAGSELTLTAKQKEWGQQQADTVMLLNRCYQALQHQSKCKKHVTSGEAFPGNVQMRHEQEIKVQLQECIRTQNTSDWCQNCNEDLMFCGGMCEKDDELLQ